jgi:hypothetical protein
VAQPLKRRGAVTAFGVLHLVFCGLGVLGLLITLATSELVAELADPAGRAARVWAEDWVLSAWQSVSQLLGIPYILMLLAGGIGLLQMKPWGRQVSLAYGWLKVVDGAAALVLIPAVLLPALSDALGSSVAAATVTMELFGVLFAVAYGIVVLVYFSRSAVRADFEAAARPAETTADVFR